MDIRVVVRAQEDHVLQRTALLKHFRRVRGERKTAKGYWIANATNGDIAALVKYYDGEYRRSKVSQSWYKDADKRQWLRDREAIANDLNGADPNALYPRNEWFWNRVLLKLSILLQVAKTRPSPTELFFESVRETLDERAQDIDEAIETTATTIDEIAETGDRLWSGLKIAGIVAAGLLGAAIVLPPVIRAFKD